MDPSQVSHQHIVDEYPHVIITGKFICHSLALIGTRMPSILLDKTSAHGHAEIVVLAVITRSVVHNVSLLLIKNIFRGIKRKKLPRCYQITTVIIRQSRLFIECKGIGARIKRRVVFLAVVIIIAFIINLEQTVHIRIGDFSLMLIIWVKQISQRLLTIPPIPSCIQIIQAGIAVLADLICHDSLIRSVPASCIIIPFTRIIIAAFLSEVERVPGVNPFVRHVPAITPIICFPLV